MLEQWVGKKRTERRKFSGVIATQAFFAIDFHLVYGSEQFPFFALEFVCCHNRRKVNHSPPPFTVISATEHLPCEQRFLSCTAFNIYEVVRVACLSRSWLRPVRNANRWTFLTGRKQTNYASDKPHERLRKRWKPCNRETSSRNGYGTLTSFHPRLDHGVRARNPKVFQVK